MILEMSWRGGSLETPWKTSHECCGVLPVQIRKLSRCISSALALLLNSQFLEPFRAQPPHGEAPSQLLRIYDTQLVRQTTTNDGAGRSLHSP